MARIGVLTGGGDCPGLNAVIRAVVRKGIKQYGHEFCGFRYGWAGVLADDSVQLGYENTRGILHRGGTILGTSRTNPYKEDGGVERLKATLREQRLDALVPIGGEDTLGVARRLVDDGVNVVGVPKTIDNDLAGTDFTFGFQTAVQIATDAIDRLHTTAESHNRVIIVEVMGRHAGWIACYSGLAGGADVILVPERPFDLDEICERLRRRQASGATFSIVVVAEGATPKDGGAWTQHAGTDAFGHTRLGGIAVELEREIEERTGFESRMTILGHVQRGGTPLAYDRVLGTRFGAAAVDAVSAGRFGMMTALRGTQIELV
ncbi:MAG: 6-phosphofructokinase, partial [Solirubrobacteraceae bacterium]